MSHTFSISGGAGNGLVTINIPSDAYLMGLSAEETRNINFLNSMIIIVPVETFS